MLSKFVSLLPQWVKHDHCGVDLETEDFADLVVASTICAVLILSIAVWQASILLATPFLAFGSAVVMLYGKRDQETHQEALGDTRPLSLLRLRHALGIWALSTGLCTSLFLLFPRTGLIGYGFVIVITAVCLLAVVAHARDTIVVKLVGIVPLLVLGLMGLLERPVHFELAISALVALGLLILVTRKVRQREEERVARERKLRMTLQQLERAREAAEKLHLVAIEASAAKTRFIATASHDLRQPLTALFLYAETLQRLTTDPLVLSVTKQIEQCTRNLERLFASLLDMSKLDAGVVQVSIKIFSMQDLGLRLVQDYQDQANGKGLQLEAEGLDDWIESDPVLFERVLRNLLENALRYTESGRVTLSWSRNGSDVTVEVTDTGPGIPISDQEKIFDEYFQINNSSRARGQGLGIGLSIVRKLSLLLGLKVELQSDEGKGSCFRLICRPADRPILSSQTKDKVRDYDVSGLKGKSLLIVDDDPEVLNSAATVFRISGCAVVTAQTRAEAIAAFSESRPDAIIIDFRLKENENGIEVLESLRTRWPGLRALVITGDTGPQPLRHILSSGYRLMHKPLRAEELVSQVRALLGLIPTPGQKLQQELAVYNAQSPLNSQPLI